MKMGEKEKREAGKMKKTSRNNLAPDQFPKEGKSSPNPPPLPRTRGERERQERERAKEWGQEQHDSNGDVLMDMFLRSSQSRKVNQEPT